MLYVGSWRTRAFPQGYHVRGWRDAMLGTHSDRLLLDICEEFDHCRCDHPHPYDLIDEQYQYGHGRAFRSRWLHDARAGCEDKAQRDQCQ